MLRLYTYAGYLETLTVPTLRQPYLGRGAVAPGESSKPEAAPRGSVLALLVSDAPCTYEINKEAAEFPRTADKDSPPLDGQVLVSFGPGWTVSVWSPECEVKPEPALAPDRMTFTQTFVDAGGTK